MQAGAERQGVGEQTSDTEPCAPPPGAAGPGRASPQAVRMLARPDPRPRVGGPVLRAGLWLWRTRDGGGPYSSIQLSKWEASRHSPPVPCRLCLCPAWLFARRGLGPHARHLHCALCLGALPCAHTDLDPNEMTLELMPVVRSVSELERRCVWFSLGGRRAVRPRRQGRPVTCHSRAGRCDGENSTLGARRPGGPGPTVAASGLCEHRALPEGAPRAVSARPCPGSAWPPLGGLVTATPSPAARPTPCRPGLLCPPGPVHSRRNMPIPFPERFLSLLVPPQKKRYRISSPKPTPDPESRLPAWGTSLWCSPLPPPRPLPQPVESVGWVLKEGQADTPLPAPSPPSTAPGSQVSISPTAAPACPSVSRGLGSWALIGHMHLPWTPGWNVPPQEKSKSVKGTGSGDF